MSASQCFRFLRPVIHRNPSALRKAAYLQFYHAARGYVHPSLPGGGSILHSVQEAAGDILETNEIPDHGSKRQDHITYKGRTEDVRNRMEHLSASGALEYPRIKPSQTIMTCENFRQQYALLKPDESRDGETVTLRGRVYSSRIAGSRLVFLDVVQDGFKVQGLCNSGRLETSGTSPEQFRDFWHVVRRGDIISITGTASRTKRGELSIKASELPLILTPSLASLPTTLDHRDTRIRNRHVDLLVNRRTADTLKLRSHIIQYIRSYLIAENFLEVQTPILADGAGGAAARPFITNATEFPERLLSLRIAPEIWLKRLVLGGMDRVFEIGSVFRNEGLDATHNPEFTTCEFYKSFADLEELIGMTESLISGLAVHVNELISTRLTSLTAIDLPKFSLPFNRIEFIPGIEAALGHSLPDLSAKTAGADLLTLFKTHSLPLPTSPTLPRLLDKLASIYLEPHCTTPTFITHHPSCLAPLSKSFICPTTKQLVSARVELFIEKSEMANMYEEENSPLEQRRKFVEQARWKDEENEALVDESYLEALEWGLPPTGGWGAGIDRICMLFTGAGRISDVLAFGSLRNVVGLGTSAVGDGKSDEN